MNSLSLTKNEMHDLLNSAYFEALTSYNEGATEEALLKLCSAEDALISFVEYINAVSYV